MSSLRLDPRATAVASLLTALLTFGVGPMAALAQSAPDQPQDPVAIGDGTHFVGGEIQPGTYRANTEHDCYWARLVDPLGDGMEIITNARYADASIVTVESTDMVFVSQGCSAWSRVEPPAKELATQDPSGAGHDAGDGGLHGFGVLFSEYGSGRAGTLGLDLGDLTKRWNRETKSRPVMQMKKRPAVEELEGGGRDFVRWFPRSKAKVGLMGFISGGEISTASLVWLPRRGGQGNDTRHAATAIHTLVEATNRSLDPDEVGEVVSALGWKSGLKSYVGVENQVARNGVRYTLAGFEWKGDEHVMLVARQVPPTVASQPPTTRTVAARS
jgi:hypothetical protein